ncbi:hypothetical protein AX17_007462 [Amanita inopinata Kibby_2008]|nr:hypothetical protein AX17_007462 [Amanita inopinata Kibby_2008]
MPSTTESQPSETTVVPTFETFKLGPYVVPRIWNGLWQLSGNAWGSASGKSIREAMDRYANLGFIAFADHYGSAELLFGQFRRQCSESKKIFGATKWCVFNEEDRYTQRSFIVDAIRERKARMRTKHVDLLQFHWQNYNDMRYIPTLNILRELQSQGHIVALGLCNFDTRRTDEICTLMGPGVISTNQVQFSLIDNRPLHGMADVCKKHNLKLLTYGTLCGGFLSDDWMDKPEPDPYSRPDSLSPSQRKYLDIIVNAWGTWELFQSLLHLLREIGDRHGGISISNIATRWVLDHPFVGATLIGARLGVSDRAVDNTKVFTFSLTDRDRRDIEKLLERSNSRHLINTVGDCGAEYR